MLFDTPPKNWQISTLGEICQEGGGDIQTGPFGSQLHASDYVFSGIPSIMPANIKEGRVSEEGIARITEADARRLSKYLTKAGDIVYSRRGDVERCALIRKREEGWLCGTGCLRVRPGSGVVDPDFCSHFLSHPETKEWISRHAVGATMPNLNTQILSALPVLLPSLQEQKAIAHILGTLDDKIELNRKTNETLEAMAKAIFKSWFVDFDPVKAKAEGRPTGLPAEISDLFPDSFEDSELGEIPNGWRVMELGMVSTFLNGYAFKSSDWQEHGVPVVKIGSVKPGFVDVDNVSFVSDEIAVSKDRYRLSPGDILIGMTGYVGEVGLVPISESPPLLNQRVGRVAPMSDAIVSRSFLYNWMRTSSFKDSVEVLSHGSAQANVSSDSIQSIPHAIPSSEIERAFASICEPILDRLLEGHREQKLLANIRDALLPKLISGEIRIPDAEKMLEEVGV